MGTEFYLGLDIGATNLKYGVVCSRGEIHHRGSEPVQASSAEQLQQQCGEIVKRTVAVERFASVRGVGIGVPGFINHHSGIMTRNPNIPSLNGSNLHQLFKGTLGLPAVIENDANAAAWGEFIRRSNPPRLLLFLTLGSGIGGGIVWNGSLWRGIDGFAAEFGHTRVSSSLRLCGCGRRGCIEAEFSTTALLAKLREALEAGAESSLGPESRGADLINAALEGDKLASCLFREGAELLGVTIANLINCFNPDIVVLGGGVTAGADVFWKPMIDAVASRAIEKALEGCSIEISKLGNDAGLIGAAGLAMLQDQQKQEA